MSMLSPTALGTPAELSRRYRHTGRNAGRGKFASVTILQGEKENGDDGNDTAAAAAEKELFFAMKRQPLQSPPCTSDVCVREWRIFRRLAELAERGLCFNFVMLVDSFVERRAEDRRRYVDLVLEFAESRLNDVARAPGLSLREFKEVAFQLVWAIAAGQRSDVQFVHRDLHTKNVLLQRCSAEGAAEFVGDGSVWYACFWVVKISDFGLSRILLADGSVVANPKDPMASLFTREKDIESIIEDLKSVGVADWTTGRADEKEQRALMRSFMRELRKAAKGCCTLRSVLSHSFFDELQQRPDAWDASRAHLSASLEERPASASAAVASDEDESDALEAQMQKLELEDADATVVASAALAAAPAPAPAPLPATTKKKKTTRRHIRH